MKKLQFCIYYLQELVIQCTYKVWLFFQKQRHGFNEQEIYGLNNTIADFIIPRLKTFRDLSKSSQVSKKELNAMIWSFENFLEVRSFMENKELNKTKYNAHQRRLAKGFALFGARYQDLFIF
jgi:hypothetical protein